MTPQNRSVYLFKRPTERSVNAGAYKKEGPLKQRPVEDYLLEKKAKQTTNKSPR